MTALDGRPTKYQPGRINQSINQFYLLKMSRDTHIMLFNCEQDNKAETSTNSCPTNKLLKKEKINAFKIAYGGVHIHCTRFYLKL